MLHVIVGLVLLVLGLFGIISWWGEFGAVLRGLIPFLLVIGGLVAVGYGLAKGKVEDLRNESQETE